ncbi:MAG: adenosylcobyric acid synthase [Candidatus Methanomethylophilaceae archaeon]|nr:adenosylcobyric acid synthase [Candidatus Methanomethylophilaceae archaeon]MDI3541937.1 adenosylcobyric acid synthase [Candidatus Methanomethylophilaceae archaeon]
MGRLMFIGTSSGAGKTTLTAAFCRILHRRGFDVAPFKTLNLSLNSFVDCNGGEMGISQAFQAWCCGLEPDCRMNPILLKPHGYGNIQTIIAGKVLSDSHVVSREESFRIAMNCFRSLAEEHDHIVIEGSGSPVELNLQKEDIANMRTARATSSPVVLVADIESGGVFAGIYGTFMLMSLEERAMIRGYIINRFRGEKSLLVPALEKMEEITGLRCFGVIPYIPLRLPAEDSLDMDSTGGLEGEDVRKAWMNNLDQLADIAEQELDIRALMSIMSLTP